MSENEKINILMVDDQPAKLLSYEAILSEMGENLIKATSAREALEHLLKSEIAIVLMDVSMPELDGFELADIIRQHPRYQKTAIIFVSAVRLTDLDLITGYQRGAVDYVSVPVIPQILRAKVSVFAELYRKTRQLEQLNSELEQHVAQRTERLRLALDAGDMSVLELDLLTNRVELDARGMHLFGIYSSEFDGTIKSVLNAIYSDDRVIVEQIIETAIKERSGYKAEFRVIDQYGSLRWLAGIGHVQVDEKGQPIRLVGINYDITERKQAEWEREQILAREQALRHEAENANRLKDEFLAMLSHELRTPLTSIVGWSSMLCDGKLKGDKVVQAIETIHRNACSQVQLIEDLLDVSSIIRGKLRLNLSPIDLSTVIELAVDSVRPTVETKRIQLHLLLDQSVSAVYGDASRLQQVIWNLLTNAIKFTPSSGHVCVRLEQVDSEARISISDTGQGIPVEFLPYVFDRFRQADQSITRKHGGLGLGLSIVRYIVEQHGGTVHVESPGIGQGSIFTVSLPLISETKSSETYKAEGLYRSNGCNIPMERMSSLNGLRVLVVDDEPDTCALLRMVLEQFNSIVTTAGSAADALTIIKQMKPDILVCDIGMPDEDGYALIGKVRALPAEQGGHIPAIALTAYAQLEDRMRALSAGYQLHVPKPIEPMELASVLAVLVGRNGYHAK
jgi:PAS domain S-box-containing protein